MQLDPKWSMIINIGALVLSSFAGAAWWIDLLGAHTAGIVTGVMFTVISAANVVLHAYSPAVGGPMAGAPTVAQAAQVTATAKAAAGSAALLVAAIFFGLLMPADLANAQAPRSRPDINLPDPLHLRDKDNTPGGGGSNSSPLDKPFQDLANFIGDDIDAAITLSTSIPDLQDGNGQKCLMALKTFGDVIKAHPAPLTFKIATDLEAFRLKQMAVNRLCQEPACTVVFADITNTIQAAATIPLPIPSLHDLCGKVPQITAVAGVTVPPAPPAPAPKPPDQP